MGDISLIQSNALLDAFNNRGDIGLQQELNIPDEIKEALPELLEKIEPDAGGKIDVAELTKALEDLELDIPEHQLKDAATDLLNELNGGEAFGSLEELKETLDKSGIELKLEDALDSFEGEFELTLGDADKDILAQLLGDENLVKVDVSKLEDAFLDKDIDLDDLKDALSGETLEDVELILGESGISLEDLKEAAANIDTGVSALPISEDDLIAIQSEAALAAAEKLNAEN